MNAVDVSKILTRVAAGVLEEAAFIFTEPADEFPEWDAPVCRTEIEFSGPRAGRLVLSATRAFCGELAANLLGLEPGDPDAERLGESALGEILNIITGSLTAELFGTQALCHLGLPAFSIADSVTAADCGKTGAHVALLDETGRRIDLLLLFDGDGL